MWSVFQSNMIISVVSQLGAKWADLKSGRVTETTITWIGGCLLLSATPPTSSHPSRPPDIPFTTNAAVADSTLLEKVLPPLWCHSTSVSIKGKVASAVVTMQCQWINSESGWFDVSYLSSVSSQWLLSPRWQQCVKVWSLSFQMKASFSWDGWSRMPSVNDFLV